MKKLAINTEEFSGCVQELSGYVHMGILSLERHMVWLGDHLTDCLDDEVAGLRADAVGTKNRIRAYNEIYYQLNKIFYAEDPAAEANRPRSMMDSKSE